MVGASPLASLLHGSNNPTPQPTQTNFMKKVSDAYPRKQSTQANAGKKVVQTSHKRIYSHGQKDIMGILKFNNG